MKYIEYKQPRCEVIEVQSIQMLCQSDDSLSEIDLGDGGFSQED